MATIKKNAPAAAEAKVEGKAVKVAVKAKAAPIVEPVVEAEVEATEAQRIGRKQLAVMIQEKIKATGKAVPLSVAEIMVVAYEEAVIDCLAAGSDVNLPGFGKFIVTDKEAGEKRNPSNGEMVMVPAHKAARFKVGAGIKKAINGGEDAEGEGDGE